MLKTMSIRKITVATLALCALLLLYLIPSTSIVAFPPISQETLVWYSLSFSTPLMEGLIVKGLIENGFECTFNHKGKPIRD